MAHVGCTGPLVPADNRNMRTILRSSLLGGLVAAILFAAPVAAAPAEQAVGVDVTPARLTVYPLGTARVQTVVSNPSGREQVFALEILLVRADGSIAIDRPSACTAPLLAE